MNTTQTSSSTWRIAAALIAMAGIVGSAEAQQGGRRNGGGRQEQRPAAAQPRQPRSAQPQQQQPRQQTRREQPAAQPRQQQGNPPAASRPSAPRPAAAPPPVQRPAPAPRPAVINPAPRQNTAPPAKQNTPATPKNPVVQQPKQPASPTAPVVRPKKEGPESPQKASPPVVVKPNSGRQNQQPPVKVDRKPAVENKIPNPPVVAVPQPKTKPPQIQAPRTSKSDDNPLKRTNGLVKGVGAPSRPQSELVRSDPPRSAAGPQVVRRDQNLPRAAASAPPAPVFRTGLTHDSGLDRSNGLQRPVYDRGHHDRPRYDHGYYDHHDYGWRHGSSFSYWGTYCPPVATYTYSYSHWPTYRSPVYCGPYSSTTVIYPGSLYTTRYTVACPPTYSTDYWNISFGFSSSSSWFGLGYSNGWWTRPYTYRSYDCWDPCLQYYRCDPCPPCPPPHGWWHRPVWGWSIYNYGPCSLNDPVFPFATNEITGAYGLVQAAPFDVSDQFEDAVYSTMRGNYQAAISTTREAVLASPESFTPGEPDLDRYQQQRATWALTVYENPPRAAVEDRDAAFMVAAISALAGDAEKAREAAIEARALGDDHPATLQLIHNLAAEQAMADWGVQSAMR